MITQQQIGEHLLFPLFRSLDSGYKERYKKDVWEQFENNIRSASYTSKISKFYENITRSMPIIVERQYAKKIIEIIQCTHDEDVLNWLRNETTYIVLIVRMLNEERKEKYKESEAEREKMSDELTDQIPHL